MASLLSSEDSLQSLSQAFTQWRKNPHSKRRIIPLSLKDRALSLLEKGVSKAALARACGVTYSALTLWQAKTRPTPRKLLIVPEENTVPDDPVAPSLLPGEQTPSPHLSLPKRLIPFYFHSQFAFSLTAPDALWLVKQWSEVV